MGKNATDPADLIFRFESLQREYQKLSETHKVCDQTLDDKCKRFDELAEELKELKDRHAECATVNPEGIQKLRAENASLEDRVSQLVVEKEEWRKVSAEQAEKIKLLEGNLSDAKLKLADEE